MVEENRELVIDWSKFKGNSNVKRAKDAYIEFCKMLDEVDFKLVGDYINNKEKVEMVYRFNEGIKLYMSPHTFKAQTYKSIVDFKNNLIKNSDEFIKFVELTNTGSLIVGIKTYDGGTVDIDIRTYGKFNKGRQDFYNKLKEVNGYTTDYYKGKKIKINIYIDSIKLNPMSPGNFKQATCKRIINFKNEIEKNCDKFIRFIKLKRNGNLISLIKTFDNGEIKLDIGSYSKFNEGRRSTYDYCNSKNYKILSSYISTREKVLIDFNCGHEPNWIVPYALKKGIGCPVCSESKGEKVIREYLEKRDIKFIQEYKFDNCRHKLPLPFDFYIPNYNLIIEFDGEQHYKVPNYFFGGEKGFKLTQKRDKIKNNYCEDNGINLLRIPYYELDNIENTLDKEFKKLREYIKNNIA